MSGQCRHEACFPDTACALGHLDRTRCEYWEQTEAEEPSSESVQDARDIPWNSYALGTSDLAILAGRGRPIVVGLIGPSNSGKTTLLAFLYMWLLEHGGLPGWAFAGSWTLGAWETVIQYSRWTGEPPPSFPPHTTSSGRVPGLLHLALRSQAGLLRDVLFTDAPGEWFTQWAKAPDDVSAVGARWVIHHSDVLLLLADRGALADEATLPRSRRETRDLIERVGALAATTPLGFTWTKIDVDLSADTRDVLERCRQQFVPSSEVLETTTDNPESIARVFSLVIDRGEEPQLRGRLIEPQSAHEPFLAFRGIHVGV